MLERIAAAGYSFADMREASGSLPRDLLLGVACGHGIAIAAASTAHLCDVGELVVERPLSSRPELTDTVVVWPHDPPWHLEERLADVRAVVQRHWTAMGAARRSRPPPRF
jgi:hypothetical protein